MPERCRLVHVGPSQGRGQGVMHQPTLGRSASILRRVVMEREVELNLIRRALAGDRTATGDLIRGHQGPLYAYMLRMCRRTDLAEDVTQEALYKAISNLRRYDARWRFSTWLFTIARRLWMNMQERKAPAYDSELLEAMPGVAPVWAVTGWLTEQRDDGARTRAVIERAMDKLPDVQREAVVLCHQLGWPIKLASELMGLPEGTIKSHLFRARMTLREQLSTWYARESSGSKDEEQAVMSVTRWSGGGGRGGAGRSGARHEANDMQRRENGQ